MDVLGAAHIRKKQRLLDASSSAPAGSAIHPSVPFSISPDSRSGAPQSPFASILESGADAADSGLYESDEDGEQCKKAMQDGSAGVKVMLPEKLLVEPAILAPPEEPALARVNNNIPGLFLLQEGNSPLQLTQANMGSEQQLTTKVPQTTGAAEGDIVMGESAVDQPGKMSEVEMRVDGGRQTEDIDTRGENEIISNEPTMVTESIDHHRENHTATSGLAEPTSVKPEETTTTSEVLQSATDKPILLPTDDENMLERPIKKEETEREETERPRGKAAYDPDFLAAAEANKGNEAAEWQFDSSDAESSEEQASDSEDSDSDEDSEDAEDSDAEDAEFPRLSLAEQAKILMADAGDDEEQSNAKGEVLRTKNEQPEDAIAIKKPDVVLTEADLLEELGEVQSVVEKLALIKAKTSGEYQVLNEGSVVALQDRTVIGTIADLLGRVQSPLYTVRFATREEISEYGITVGTKIFYSTKHSTFVFTKALKAQKGSDASNLWDEEVDEHEVEFSDDEAEAEYKRKLKEKKAGGKGGKVPYQREAQGSGRASAPSNDEPYTPLARPPHLSDLMKEMAHMAQPVEKSSNRGGHSDKNRGDTRKAGRGGNRGGRDERHSGGRDNGRGPNERRGHGNQQSPPAPTYQQAQQAYQQAPQYGYHYGGYTSQQYSQQPQQPLQPLHQQLSFAYQTQPATQAQPSFQHQNAGQSQVFASSSPMPKLPQGAHVNPAFLARQTQSAQQVAYFNPQMMWGQQQQQQQQVQYQQNSPPPAQGQFSWPPPAVPPQQADAVMKAVQDQLDILKGVRK